MNPSVSKGSGTIPQDAEKALRTSDSKSGRVKLRSFPLIVGADENAFKMAMALQEEGVFANVAASPAVPPGKALIRTSLHGDPYR